MQDSSVLVSKQINRIDFLSNALQIGRTSLFIQILGVTVRWISINGSDETVHREPFHLNRGRPILMEGLDLIHVGERYITHLIAAVGLQYDALYAITRVKS